MDFLHQIYHAHRPAKTCSAIHCITPDLRRFIGRIKRIPLWVKKLCVKPDGPRIGHRPEREGLKFSLVQSNAKLFSHSPRTSAPCHIIPQFVKGYLIKPYFRALRSWFPMDSLVAFPPILAAISVGVRNPAFQSSTIGFKPSITFSAFSTRFFSF